MIPRGVGGRYNAAWGIFRYHILLEGPVCRAWYLGEIVVCQSLGIPALFIPMMPLVSMRSADSLSIDRVIQFTVGLEAEYFQVEGDYAVFIQTHLMPPLTSVRGGEGARAPVARMGPKASRAARAYGRSFLLHLPIGSIPGRLTKSLLSLHQPGTSLSGFEARLQYVPHYTFCMSNSFK